MKLNDYWCVCLIATHPTTRSAIALLMTSSKDNCNLGRELILAVRRNDLESVSSILSRDDASSIPKQSITTSLINAVSRENVEITQLILETKAADVDGWLDQVPLVFAARENNIELVKLLLEAGADHSKKDENTFTALMYAANCGNLPMVQLLVSAGADVYIENYEGEMALDLAFHSGHQQVLSFLEEHCDAEIL